MANTSHIAITQPHVAIESKSPHAKLDEAFYKVARLVADLDTVVTFRRLKSEGNTASATALATGIGIDKAPYLMPGTAQEYKQVINEEQGPSLYDFPETLR